MKLPENCRFSLFFAVVACGCQLLQASETEKLTSRVSVVDQGSSKKFLVAGKTVHELMEATSIIDLSIDPRIKFPANSISKVRGISLGVYNLTSSVHGIKIGIDNLDYGNSVAVQIGAVNKEIKDLSGAQFSIVGNAVDGTFSGVQAGLLYNTCFGNYSYGLQLAAVNLNETGFGGISAGAINFDAGRRDGVHLGIFNLAGSFQGAQLGLFNLAGNMKSGGGYCRGIQIGLINSCDGALQGVQMGILNTAQSNALHWSLGLNVGF